MNLIDLYKKFYTKENLEIKKRIFSAQGEAVLSGKNFPLDLVATEKIWNKYFRFMPIKLALPIVKYRLDKKKVLDIGSSWGEFLIHFGPDSKGIEVLSESVKFSRAIGLNVSEYNFEDEWRENSASFDVVWCSNVLEHVVAPHLLLRRFHDALRPNGIIFIRVPTIPSNWLYIKLNRIFLGFLGYEAVQHINAFTRKTAEFAVMRAGFKIIESNCFLPKNKMLNKILNPILRDVISFTTIVGQKVPFEYHEKRPEIHNPKWLNLN